MQPTLFDIEELEKSITYGKYMRKESMYDKVAILYNQYEYIPVAVIEKFGFFDSYLRIDSFKNI